MAALDSAGTIAAPLLAGFSATLVGLLIDKARASVRWPDAAILLLVIAVIAFIVALQASFGARRYAVTPHDLMGWYPGVTPHSLSDQQGMYRGSFLRWASYTRFAYRLGILSFLSGFTLVLVPEGSAETSRWLVVGVSSLGCIGELLWIVRDIVVRLPERLRFCKTDGTVR